MNLIEKQTIGDITIYRKLLSVDEPIMKADWCECGMPDIKLLEKNHLCWCRCMSCGRESVEVWDDSAEAIMNWLKGNMRNSSKSCYEDHFGDL